jgi:hypothetical protein
MPMSQRNQLPQERKECEENIELDVLSHGEVNPIATNLLLITNQNFFRIKAAESP